MQRSFADEVKQEMSRKINLNSTSQNNLSHNKIQSAECISEGSQNDQTRINQPNQTDQFDHL